MSAPTLAQQYAAIYDQSIKEAFRTLDKSKKWWEYLRYVRGVKCVYKNEEKKDAEAKNLLFYLPLASTSPKEIEDRIISILSKVDALEGISTSKLIAEYKRLYDGMVTLELKKHTEEKFDRFVASLPGVLTHYETKSDGQVEKQFSLPPMTTTSNSHMSSSSNDFNDDASITDHTDNNSFDGYDPFDHEVTTIENTMLNRTVSSSYALSGTSSRQSPDFISHGIDESYNADYNQKANSNSTFIEAAEDGSTTSVSMSDIPMSMKLQVSVLQVLSTWIQWKYNISFLSYQSIERKRQCLPPCFHL